jgi:hypothetical protein
MGHFAFPEFLQGNHRIIRRKGLGQGPRMRALGSWETSEEGGWGKNLGAPFPRSVQEGEELKERRRQRLQQRHKPHTTDFLSPVTSVLTQRTSHADEEAEG